MSFNVMHLSIVELTQIKIDWLIDFKAHPCPANIWITSISTNISTDNQNAFLTQYEAKFKKAYIYLSRAILYDCKK